MSPANIKAIFIVAICSVLWGGYKIAMASYTSIAWDKAEGEIIDFEQNTWSCGKGTSVCYKPIAGFHANKKYFTTISDKKFNRDEPKHLIGNKVVIYYNPVNPREATFGGEYGPMNGGIFIFLFGTVILVIFWFVQKKEE